jgi:hypothetical protein
MNDATGSASEVLVPVSRRRLLLAIYLDFVVFSALWGLLDHYLFRGPEGWRSLSGPAKFTTFLLLELLLHKTVRWSPGRWLLSIVPMGGTPVLDGPEEPRRFGVPATILARENWLTLLAGTLLLLDGAKGVVRWTMFTPPAPFFGWIPGAAVWPWIAVADGMIECAIAYLFFRLRPAAVAVGIPYLGLTLASIVTSWDLWDAWVADYVVRRRAYQGLPVRPDEIEKMQAFTPEMQVAAIAFSLVIMAVAGFFIIRNTRRTLVAAV